MPMVVESFIMHCVCSSVSTCLGSFCMSYVSKTTYKRPANSKIHVKGQIRSNNMSHKQRTRNGSPSCMSQGQMLNRFMTTVSITPLEQAVRAVAATKLKVSRWNFLCGLMKFLTWINDHIMHLPWNYQSILTLSEFSTNFQEIVWIRAWIGPIFVWIKSIPVWLWKG